MKIGNLHPLTEPEPSQKLKLVHRRQNHRPRYYHHYHLIPLESQQVGAKITQNQTTNLKVIQEDQKHTTKNTKAKAKANTQQFHRNVKKTNLTKKHQNQYQEKTHYMILRLTIANQRRIGTGEPRHISLTSYIKEDGNGHDYQMEKLNNQFR